MDKLSHDTSDSAQGAAAEPGTRGLRAAWTARGEEQILTTERRSRCPVERLGRGCETRQLFVPWGEMFAGDTWWNSVP